MRRLALTWAIFASLGATLRAGDDVFEFPMSRANANREEAPPQKPVYIRPTVRPTTIAPQVPANQASSNPWTRRTRRARPSVQAEQPITVSPRVDQQIRQVAAEESISQEANPQQSQLLAIQNFVEGAPERPHPADRSVDVQKAAYPPPAATTIPYETPATRPMPLAEDLRRPSQLPKVTQIMPYFDYEPDPQIAKEDPCRNLCPRPDGAPCKPLPSGRIPECPHEVTLAEQPYHGRAMAPSLYTWEASNIYYNPLYFEDAPFERYGHTYPCWIQPFVSVAKFGGQLVALPYQMTIDPPCSCVYPLGFYRPGECAPKKLYQIPWNTHAAVVQAGATAGAIALFP